MTTADGNVIGSTQRRTRYLIAGLVWGLSQLAGASPAPESVSFSHKDWDLVCDNTLTCRAVGYSPEDKDPAASVMLSRDAGPGTPVGNQVVLADYDGEVAAKHPGAPVMQIDGHSQGKLLPVTDNAWYMSPTQFSAFMQALRRDSKISFKDKVNEYIFSGDGASAVLLKMDDVQGRVGTTGALMKKGSNNESAVKKPVAVPNIVAVPVRDKQARNMTAAESARIKPTLMKRILNKNDECDKERVQGDWQIAALNEQQSLVITPCWLGAYNSGDVYTVIRNDMTAAPQWVTDSASNYEKGVINASMKDRGLGDCWSTKEWVWDGKQFQPSAAGDTGRCRLLNAGGAWDLPTLKTNIVSH